MYSTQLSPFCALDRLNLLASYVLWPRCCLCGTHRGISRHTGTVCDHSPEIPRVFGGASLRAAFISAISYLHPVLHWEVALNAYWIHCGRPVRVSWLRASYLRPIDLRVTLTALHRPVLRHSSANCLRSHRLGPGQCSRRSQSGACSRATL